MYQITSDKMGQIKAKFIVLIVIVDFPFWHLDASRVSGLLYMNPQSDHTNQTYTLSQSSKSLQSQ